MPGGAEGARRHSRRGLLGIAALAAAALALPRVWQRLRPDAPRIPHDTVAGFYRLPDSAVSGVMDPFAGLGAPDPDAIVPATLPGGGPAICSLLFRDGRAPGTVPVAYFTDANCALCREMDPWVNTLPADRVSLTVHDLPLLGPTSVIAARAVAAAARQGAGPQMRARLNRVRLQPDPAYIGQLAKGIGLAPQRLVADMSSADVTDRIAQSLGLGVAFRIIGTPALVIGDTLAVGRRSEADLRGMVDAAARRLEDMVCT